MPTPAEIVDAAIAKLPNADEFPTSDRRGAIEALVSGEPAILNGARYHNQLAPNYLHALLSSDAYWLDRYEANPARVREYCIPYYVALNDAGRKMLADMAARVSPMQLAAE